MTDDTVKLITLQLSALQKTMKENGLIFAVSADNAERSCIAFLGKKQYFANEKKGNYGKPDGAEQRIIVKVVRDETEPLQILCPCERI